MQSERHFPIKPGALSSAEASYHFFVRETGEVKSKRAEPGEEGNESARGTPPFRSSHRPTRALLLLKRAPLLFLRD